MTTEQKIANIFMSGQYELAIQLAHGQGIQFDEIPVDFNRMIKAKEDFPNHLKWARIDLLNGISISIAAGALFFSKNAEQPEKYKTGIASPVATGEWLTFEVGLMFNDYVFPESRLNEIPSECFYSAQYFNDAIELVTFAHMTNQKILKLVNYASSL